MYQLKHRKLMSEEVLTVAV